MRLSRRIRTPCCLRTIVCLTTSTSSRGGAADRPSGRVQKLYRDEADGCRGGTMSAETCTDPALRKKFGVWDTRHQPAAMLAPADRSHREIANNTPCLKSNSAPAQNLRVFKTSSAPISFPTEPLGRPRTGLEGF
jgi:hypothetical protein